MRFQVSSNFLSTSRRTVDIIIDNGVQDWSYPYNSICEWERIGTDTWIVIVGQEFNCIRDILAAP